jgi:hypothetical protein
MSGVARAWAAAEEIAALQTDFPEFDQALLAGMLEDQGGDALETRAVLRVGRCASAPTCNEAHRLYNQRQPCVAEYRLLSGWCALLGGLQRIRNQQAAHERKAKRAAAAEAAAGGAEAAADRPAKKRRAGGKKAAADTADEAAMECTEAEGDAAAEGEEGMPDEAEPPAKKARKRAAPMGEAQATKRQAGAAAEED